MLFLSQLRNRLRIIPYLALVILLTGSVWLLYKDSKEAVEQSAAGIIQQSDVFYDSVYQESKYFERKLYEIQIERSRGFW